MNQYLDTTVTKFLENDISVTKFLAQRSNDVTVTKFLDHAVAHFLASNDVTVTKFLQDNDISVTKFLENDISVTKFLGTASTRFLETNDISVTKFLDVTVTKFLSSNETAITKYLAANDVSVTKFMEAAITNFLLDSQAVDNYMLDNEISITKFLNSEDGIAVTKYLDSSSTPTVNQSNGMGQQNINMTIIEFLEANDYPYEGYLHGREEYHEDEHISTYHPTHRSLDHAFDDQRDVHPVHYHEHAVHHSFPAADARSYNHSEGQEEDSIATAHHVHREATPYEHSHDDYTMDPHYIDPVSHAEAHHRPVYSETHDTHHHEAPRYDHYQTYHVSHPELDHKFDDQRDVEPVHYHERAVHGSFDAEDAHSYDHDSEYYGHGRRSHEEREDSIVTDHHVQREATPYEHSHDDYTMDPHYIDPASHAEAHHRPVYSETHDTHHHEAPRYDHYQTYHVSHPELDHKFDDQRDVEPVHYHEHAVHGSFGDEDARSYEHNYHGVDRFLQ